MLQTLTRKVTLAALIFVVLLTLAATLTIPSIVGIRQAAEHVIEHTAQHHEVSVGFLADLNRALAESEVFGQTREDDARADAHTALEAAQRKLAALGDLHLASRSADAAPDSADTKLYERQFALFNNVQQRVTDLARAVEVNDEGEITQALNTLEPFEDELAQLGDDETTVFAQESTAALSTTNMLTQRLLGIAAGAVTFFSLLTLLGLLGLRRYIVQPINTLAAMANTVARGDLDQGVRVTTTDEIGTLQRSFNQMVHNLKEHTYALVRERESLKEHIVERTRTEELLRASEERLRTIVTNVPIVLFAVDREGVFTLSEGKGLQVLGLAPGQIVGLSVFDVYRDMPELVDNVRRAFAGEAFSAISNVAGIMFETWYTPLREPNGAVAGIIGVATDITERTRTEEIEARRVHHVALQAEISQALSIGGPLPDVLQRCATALVDHLNVAFSRIWTLGSNEHLLELQASAGLYTHLDGAHSRIPVGQYKIGRIAAARQPHLTNDVLNDPQVSDKAWAKHEGMVAFAG